MEYSQHPPKVGLVYRELYKCITLRHISRIEALEVDGKDVWKCTEPVCALEIGV
jgi:hypothetical protein